MRDDVSIFEAMKLILALFIISSRVWAQVSDPIASYQQFVSSDKLALSRNNHIIAEHMVNMMKLVEKGYINQDVLTKVIRETEVSKNFLMFVPWLKSIQEISRISDTSSIISTCKQYTLRREHYPLERVLEKLAGNYCRERALQAISRDIDKSKVLSDATIQFIQENLKYFLVKKNKKNFAYFLQSQSNKPDILKKISQVVTTYSVTHEIVPDQEVLKDIVLNEQITNLIQDKGFNPLQNQNVFFGEFKKLVEVGIKSLDPKSPEGKVKEHFNHAKNYLELNQDHLPVGLCLTRMNDFAKAIFRVGYKDLSREVFKFIVKKNSKDIQEEALFFYLWTYISGNEFKDALKVADKFDLLKDKSSIVDPRIKFWIGYALEETDEKADAISYYENIVFNHPLSYYAIMATKKLQALRPNSEAVDFYSKNAIKEAQPLSFDFKELDDDHLSSLIRLKAWAKIDSQKMIELELKRLSKHSLPRLAGKFSGSKQQQLKSDMHIVNAKIIQESQNYLNTFRYLYGVLDKKEVIFNRALLEILYPKPFLKDLAKTLKKDTLDPLVILSLIRQESVFNPMARSPVGARGLMQIMPTTAKGIRRSVKEKQLHDPQTNLELGTKYFKGLLRRYEGNLVYVLSAYNAGETRVERWRNLYFDSDATILKNIEEIPFSETRNYVKLIFRNIFFYKLLTQNSEVADPSEPNKIYDVSLGFKK